MNKKYGGNRNIATEYRIAQANANPRFFIPQPNKFKIRAIKVTTRCGIIIIIAIAAPTCSLPLPELPTVPT